MNEPRRKPEKPPHPDAATSDDPPSPDEKVVEASWESFPASDPPGWIGGAATRKDSPAEEDGHDEKEAAGQTPTPPDAE